MTTKEIRHSIPDNFEEVFSKYRNGFVGIAKSYVCDADVAEDIVTDSFIYVWEHQRDLSWNDNIKGYIYMAVRARCISWLRSRHAMLKAKDSLSVDIKWKIETSLNSLSGEEHSAMFRSEIMKIYRMTLAAMPELTREIFLSSRDNGMTYNEIADLYKISVRKVTYEIQHALRIFREAFKDYLPERKF